MSTNPKHNPNRKQRSKPRRDKRAKEDTRCTSPQSGNRKSRRHRHPPPQDDAKANPYNVTFVDIGSIQPSPENDEIYGDIKHDEQMEALIASIESRDLAEPLILTRDRYVLSGHRRLYALKKLGWTVVPVRFEDVRREGNPGFRHLLTEYNPQRIKSAGTLLKEALLRFSDDDADPAELLQAHREASIQFEVEFCDVDGTKWVSNVSPKKREFLEAVQQVIESLRKYWPLSIRQVHYNLLNAPPLIQVPKRSKFDLEHYRYRNDETSYNALVELLKSARYHGHVSMTCIDDPTRPLYYHVGFDSVSEFIQSEMDGFLLGYHRHRQLDQPRHIEVFGEKNTLKTILEPICREYYVPLSLGRGYASIPVWRDMANRFKRSGKDRMTLIIATDYDPEGLDLADDAIRSLRDLWHIPVDYHRLAVTREQIDELDLVNDFNPAKIESSRYDSFIERTGGNESWEIEALPPDYLQEQLRAAIEGNMDMEIYREGIAKEQADCEELQDFRRQMLSDLDF